MQLCLVGTCNLNFKNTTALLLIKLKEFSYFVATIMVMECCNLDVLELIVQGGLLVSETGYEVKGVAAKSWQKALVVVYVTGSFILALSEIILEGLTLRDVTSPITDIPSSNYYSKSGQNWQPDMGVQDCAGFILWKIGFFLAVSLLLPFELWLLTHTLVGAKCCGRLPDGERRDPYFFCFDRDDDVDHGAEDNCCQVKCCTRKNCWNRICCKKVSVKIFLLVESIVHIMISVGRFYFFTASPTNSMFAFSGFTIASGGLLVTTDLLSLMVKSYQFYNSMPCCSDATCTKYTAFPVLSFYFAATALCCSVYNLLIFASSGLKAERVSRYITILSPSVETNFRGDEYIVYALVWLCFMVCSMVLPACLCGVSKLIKCLL